MEIKYDVFAGAFLAKITEYNYAWMDAETRESIVDSYMKWACSEFNRLCKYDLCHGDDKTRTFTIDGITSGELDEIVNIVSDGMLVRWLQQYVYKQENLENMLNSSDFSAYSPAELTYRLNTAYTTCRKTFFDEMNHYSYNHGDLSDLHL